MFFKAHGRFVICICAVLLILQAQSRAQGSLESVLASSFTSLADGGVEVIITNKSNQDITAYALVASYRLVPSNELRRDSIRWHDSECLAHPPLLPEQSQVLRFGGIHSPDEWKIDVKIGAVVLADGTVFGEPEWIRRIISRRRELHNHLGIGIARLEAAKRVGAPKATVAQELQDLAASHESRSPARSGERTGIRQAYRYLVQNLAELPVDNNDQDFASDLQTLIDDAMTWRSRLSSSKPSLFSE